jgi:hypothetical protein
MHGAVRPGGTSAAPSLPQKNPPRTHGGNPPRTRGGECAGADPGSRADPAGPPGRCSFAPEALSFRHTPP